MGRSCPLSIHRQFQPVAKRLVAVSGRFWPELQRCLVGADKRFTADQIRADKPALKARVVSREGDDVRVAVEDLRPDGYPAWSVYDIVVSDVMNSASEQGG